MAPNCTDADEDGIARMAKVPDRHPVFRRQMQSACRELFTRGFKGDGGDAKSEADEAGQCAAERMACHPDLSFGIPIADVLVNLLEMKCL